MAMTPLTREQAEAAWHLVQKHGAVWTAASAIGIPESTLAKRYNAALKRFGFPPIAPPVGQRIDSMIHSEAEADTPEGRRDVRDAAFWRRKSVELQKQLADAEHLAEQLAGLRDQRYVIPDWLLDRTPTKPGKALVGLLLSDIHAGEVVDAVEVNGLNKYNVEICRTRLRRLFSAACEIGPRWLADCKSEGALLALGGDLISGDIHEELRITNEIQSHEQVRLVVEEVSAGITHMADTFGKVVVASVPGNHARTTIRPTSKLYSQLSFDTAIAHYISDRFRDDDKVEFIIGTSPDQIIPIFGHSVMLSHGDKLGTGGGQGYAGPDLPIVRGGKKAASQQASVGQAVDLLLRGHLHYSTNPYKVLSNGSVVGLNEYARDLRGEVQNPRQWLFLFHSKWGLRERLDLQLEDPLPPAKPRVRVYV